jgi:Prokaryotic homologs of the JAB domain
VTPRRSETTPLPALYDDLEPTYRAELGYEAEKTIRADIAWTQENVGADIETGGWLLAAPRNPSYLLAATVPGFDASFGRSTINLGFEQLEIVQRQHGERPVGCWHLHPQGDDVPSDTDMRAWTRGAQLAGGRWLSVIAAPSRSWREDITLSGWITFGPKPGQMITERLRLN